MRRFFWQSSHLALFLNLKGEKSMKEVMPKRFLLQERELPQNWMNMAAILPNGMEDLKNPQTNKAVSEQDLKMVFCDELVKQELNRTDVFIPIPTKVQDYYHGYRPSPLVRAYDLEKYLETPAHIYYKFEGQNTSGSHKLNSAIAQAYYAKEQGLTGLTTETGAGQWGSALAMACAHFGLDLNVFMVKLSYEQKPYRKELMKIFQTKVTPSPSDTTNAGREILKTQPQHTGTLGTAISEAVEVAVSTEGYKYALGSVLNQVLLHQSIIGLETNTALDYLGIEPDILIGCAGGGSNFGGFIAPFMHKKITEGKKYHMIAVEPSSCPSFTKGTFRFDYCDAQKICPLSKMYTLGHDFVPSIDHVGGLRYHGMSPILSQLYEDQMFEARAVLMNEVFESAKIFARCEGILPALESSHAIKVAIDEAIRCKKQNRKENIVFCLSGTGYFDLGAYGEK